MDISTDPRSVAEIDPAGAARVAAELEAEGMGYEPEDVDPAALPAGGPDIEVAFGQGGRFDYDETERLLDAIDQAREEGKIRYLSLDGERVAIIAPLPAAKPGPVASGPTRFVSRQGYDNGTRQEVEAVRLTAANHQRIIGWLKDHAETAAWGTEPPRLDFGGRRGSYSIEPGWWVVLYTPETTPARAGVEGWDPDDFGACWIAKSSQDRYDRESAVAYRATRGNR